MTEAILVVEISIKVTIIWYFMACVGSTPANIKPDIIPGRLTNPTVLAESIVGDIPALILSLTIEIEACFKSAPKASFSKICCR